MDFLFDPSLWAGLITLIVLEIVLGIDNLVFVAILAKKLPAAQQDRALYTGLGLALVMRLGLLSIMSWLVSLTTPVFTVFGHPFSWRDLILLAGGVFLLFKATSELHERLEALPHTESKNRGTAGFWTVIAQILLLDAVFSVDSIITAVGMVDNLGIMSTAVVVAMIVMVAASRPLTAFVNDHPTVVVLCLSFLLMIGLSLLAEGLGFHIPKGYLYAAIAFSILIETFNQIATRNRVKHELRLPFRERTTRAVLRLLAKKTEEPVTETEAMLPATAKPFAADEREMVEGVLSLADRSVRMIMTPRAEIGWLDLEKDFETLCADVKDLHHSLFPVGEGSLDNLVGFVKAKDLIDCRDTPSLRALALKRRPFLVPETISLIRLVRDLRKNRATLVLVTATGAWQPALLAAGTLGFGYILTQPTLVSLSMDADPTQTGLCTGLIGLGVFAGGGVGSALGSQLVALGGYDALWIAAGLLLVAQLVLGGRALARLARRAG